MLIISTRDFRANQTMFLDMVNKGEDVVLKSRASGSFRITPIEDDLILTKRDVMKELKGALQEVKEHLNGKRSLKSLEELINEL